MEQPAEKDDDQDDQTPASEGGGTPVDSDEPTSKKTGSEDPSTEDTLESEDPQASAPETDEQDSSSEEIEEDSEEDEDLEPEEKAPPLPVGILRNQPWMTFLFPFIVFMMITQFEPAHPDSLEQGEENENLLHIHIEYEDYPKVYTVKIVLTVLAMLYVLPGYRTFPFSVHWEALAVGVLGAIAWIFLCELKLEDQLYSFLGMTDLVNLERRSGFNPLAEMKDTPVLAYAFLGVRLFGLVVVVAIMEEFFLRGFVMRMFVDFDYWEEVPFGKWNDLALAAGTLVPVLSHPKTELLAVIVWFSAVTWLMLRRNSIWDCITAHAITNLIVGCYVIYSGSWWLM